MKISIISEGYFPEISGVTVSLHKRLEHLSAWGHRVQVFAPDYSALSHLYPNYKDYVGEILPGVTVHPFESIPYYVDYTRDPKPFSFQKLEAKISEFAPHILHVECPERLFMGFFSRPGIRLARKLKIPASAIYHTNYLSYADDYKEQVRWLGIPGMIYLLKKVFVWVYNSYDVLMVASPDVSNYLRAWGVKNIHQAAYNGVDLEQFFPAESVSIENGNVNFLYVGRLTADKGIRTLLQACNLVYERLPNATFTFIGGGPEAAMLNQWAETHPRGKILGRIPYAEMGEHLRQAHILVTASTKEQRPLTLLEATRAGLPIIGPASGGVKEIIRHEISGLLVPPNDAAALAEAMIRIANNPQLYQAFREATLQTSQNQSWEASTKEMLNTWERLTRGEKPAV